MALPLGWGSRSAPYGRVGIFPSPSRDWLPRRAYSPLPRAIGRRQGSPCLSQEGCDVAIVGRRCGLRRGRIVRQVQQVQLHREQVRHGKSPK
eukprot:1183897-Prorocentrum_minimum.AAC.1